MTTLPAYEIASETALDQSRYIFPASFAQRRLWFLDQLEPQNVAYNIPASIYLKVALDVEALEQSLHALIQRHEVLRTTFVAIDGQPMQVIAPTLKVPLSVVDLSALSEAQREAETLRLANLEVQRPFDLVQGPLLRTALLKLGAEEYVLLLTIHHIISDEWSMGVLYQELAAFYGAFSAGQSSPLPDLLFQYADFAIWQQEQAQGDQFAEHLAYWKQHLAGAPATLDLPTDRPHPTTPTSQGSMYFATLPKDLVETLKALSRQERVTLYMMLVAAFQSLLYRYTGQDDMVIGTVTAGRTQVETEAQIGFFVNTLVLHTDLSGNPSFRDLLARVREVVLEAYAHQDVPFESLVKELRPERNISQNPLFQVLLTLDPPLPTLSSGWTSAPMAVQTGAAKFDLSLGLSDQPWGMVCRFEYRTDLFDETTIARMAWHWRTLLDGIVADPSQRLSALPLLTEVERQQLLVEWNSTASDYPKSQCVHQLFEAQVERAPGAVALVFENEYLTYRELNRQANQLAHCLQRLGVGPEVMVGLCMDRSFEMVVGLLGILKAGGAYAPLDPSYPKERLTFMLEDTRAPVLLTQEKYVDVLPAQKVHMISLDTGWEAISQEPTDNLSNKMTAENLAYVMYTSGSTGKPKGVEIRHRSITRLLFGIDYARLDATRTILHMSPISFDASTFEVWGALLHGARCILFPERVPTPGRIASLIQKHQVTTLWLTASLFNAIVDESPEALRGLEQLLTGGEALSVVHIRRALEELPGIQLINGYGPTESTTFACCHPIPNPLSENMRSIPIGRSIGNTQVYILDRHLNAVPVGVPGELHIGGDGLARGYLNRPDLTNERFIAHPFSDKPGARLYKTGDLVRYLPDGSIEFLGRLDQQVKLRGFRIEPGEIEVVLAQYPAIREAAVIARQDERAEKYLVAYVVPLEEQKITFSELRSFLKEHLPDYMVPPDFVLLDAMPLTPNGKVDQRALPAPQRGRRMTEEIFVAPTSLVHHQLVQIWEELLDARPIGMRDNFFHLGGHSLLAARLVQRIEQVCGKKISLATLFAGPTIEQLADAFQCQEDKGSRTPVVGVQTDGSRRPFFFLHGDWTGGAFYCFALARALGADQPFYVLEPYRLDRQEIPPTLEAMATAHLEALRAIQPEGPYLLAGFCNGGLLAYEIARQLHAEGQKVDLLFLINPTPPARYNFLRNVVSRLANVIKLSQEQQADCFLRLRHMLRHVYRYLHSSNDRRLADFEKLLSVDARLDSMFPATEALRKDFVGVFTWLGSGYQPGFYPGKVMRFWSREDAILEAVWRRLAPAKEVEDHIIPGTHMSCVTTHTRDLAQLLSAYLSEVQ